jgi:hypothetical protein
MMWQILAYSFFALAGACVITMFIGFVVDTWKGWLREWKDHDKEDK